MAGVGVTAVPGVSPTAAGVGGVPAFVVGSAAAPVVFVTVGCSGVGAAIGSCGTAGCVVVTGAVSRGPCESITAVPTPPATSASERTMATVRRPLEGFDSSTATAVLIGVAFTAFGGVDNGRVSGTGGAPTAGACPAG